MDDPLIVFLNDWNVGLNEMSRITLIKKNNIKMSKVKIISTKNYKTQIYLEYLKSINVQNPNRNVTAIFLHGTIYSLFIKRLIFVIIKYCKMYTVSKRIAIFYMA